MNKKFKTILFASIGVLVCLIGLVVVLIVRNNSNTKAVKEPRHAPTALP